MNGAKAPAKLNLFFEVGARRPDGYHEVLSLYQSLDLYEQVLVEPAPSWSITVSGSLPQNELDLVPTDESNLVVKAAWLLASKAGISNPQPMHFEIVKSVPVAGGVAGGSADAAAALVALNEAWCLGFEMAELIAFGAELGADVPFALLGKTAIGEDSGVVLTSIPSLPRMHVLLVFSQPGISTRDSFAIFDRLYPDGDLKHAKSELIDFDFSKAGTNSLLEPALELRPDLAQMMQLVPGQTNLSGSGPTLYCLSEDKSEIQSWQQVFHQAGYRTLVSSFGDSGAGLI